MQDTDSLVTKMMHVADSDGIAPDFRAVMLNEVKRLVQQGECLAPYITRYLKSCYLWTNPAREWLDLGFDLNTRFSNGRKINQPWWDDSEYTLLDLSLGSAARDEPETCELVEMLCIRGSPITPDTYEPRLYDTPIRAKCRRIVHLHYIQRTLIALVAARVAHPDILGVLKGFLI